MARTTSKGSLNSIWYLINYISYTCHIIYIVFLMICTWWAKPERAHVLDTWWAHILQDFSVKDAHFAMRCLEACYKLSLLCIAIHKLILNKNDLGFLASCPPSRVSNQSLQKTVRCNGHCYTSPSLCSLTIVFVYSLGSGALFILAWREGRNFREAIYQCINTEQLSLWASYP